MQVELSVQFDDLFKKAWEEDVTESVEDGIYAILLQSIFVFQFLWLNCGLF